MAEWMEVTNQFNRMCLYYQRKHDCPMGCPMNGVSISQCRKVAFDRPKETEEIVTQWAAEHPEPVYPTWGTWLGTKYDYDLREILYTPIPADIAQKLGIEPKENI